MRIMLQKGLRVHARLVRAEYDVAQCNIISTEGTIYQSGDMRRHKAESWVLNTARDLARVLVALARALVNEEEVRSREGMSLGKIKDGRMTVTLLGDRNLVLFDDAVGDLTRMDLEEWVEDLYERIDQLYEDD